MNWQGICNCFPGCALSNHGHNRKRFNTTEFCSGLGFGPTFELLFTRGLPVFLNLVAASERIEATKGGDVHVLFIANRLKNTEYISSFYLAGQRSTGFCGKCRFAE